MRARFARPWTCLLVLTGLVGAGCVCAEAESCRGCCRPHVGAGPASDGPDWCDCEPARRPAVSPAFGTPPALPIAVVLGPPTSPRWTPADDNRVAAGRRQTDHHRGRAPPHS